MLKEAALGIHREIEVLDAFAIAILCQPVDSKGTRALRGQIQDMSVDLGCEVEQKLDPARTLRCFSHETELTRTSTSKA